MKTLKMPLQFDKIKNEVSIKKGLTTLIFKALTIIGILSLSLILTSCFAYVRTPRHERQGVIIEHHDNDEHHSNNEHHGPV